MARNRHRRNHHKNKQQHPSHQPQASTPTHKLVEKSDYLAHTSSSKGLLATCFGLLVAANKIFPAAAQSLVCSDPYSGIYFSYNGTSYSLYPNGVTQYNSETHSWGPCLVPAITYSLFYRVSDKLYDFACGSIKTINMPLVEYLDTIADIVIGRGFGQQEQEVFEQCLDTLIKNEDQQLTSEVLQGLIVIGIAVGAIAGTCALGYGAYRLGKFVQSWCRGEQQEQVSIRTPGGPATPLTEASPLVETSTPGNL